MKLLRPILSLLLIFLVTAACSSIEKPTYSEGEPSNTEAPKQEQNYIIAEVSRVTDGDTMEITDMNLEHLDKSLKAELSDTQKVRFLALDTPEITKGKNELYGQEAKELVEHLLQDNQVMIEIDSKATFDDYGRLLGHVFTSEGESVQLALLESGLARIAYVFDDYKYMEDYQSAEEHAEKEALNIHSYPGYVTDSGFDMSVVDTDITDMTINEIINDMEKSVTELTVSDIWKLFNE